MRTVQASHLAAQLHDEAVAALDARYRAQDAARRREAAPVKGKPPGKRVVPPPPPPKQAPRRAPRRAAASPPRGLWLSPREVQALDALLATPQVRALLAGKPGPR